MASSGKLTLRITKAEKKETGGPSTNLIVVSRPFSQLKSRLKRTFADKENYKVIVDRRNGDRRKRDTSVDADRRTPSPRRMRKAEIVEVIMMV